MCRRSVCDTSATIVHGMDTTRRRSRKSDGRHRDALISVRITTEALLLLDAEVQHRGVSRGDVVLDLLETNLTTHKQTNTNNAGERSMSTHMTA